MTNLSDDICCLKMRLAARSDCFLVECATLASTYMIHICLQDRVPLLACCAQGVDIALQLSFAHVIHIRFLLHEGSMAFLLPPFPRAPILHRSYMLLLV